MDILQPRRILLLSPANVSTLPVLKALTGGGPGRQTTSSRPQPATLASSTPAATITNAAAAAAANNHNNNGSGPTQAHEPLPPLDPEEPLIHRISTAYYSASIPIWTDSLTASAAAWSAQWRSTEGAADVVRAVAAWIVCFPKPGPRSIHADQRTALEGLLGEVAGTIKHHLRTPPSYGSDGGGGGSHPLGADLDEGDVVLLAVAVHGDGHDAGADGMMVRSADHPPPSLPAAPLGREGVDTAGGGDDEDGDLEADLEDLCRGAGGWEYVDGTVPLSSTRKNGFGETVGLQRMLEALMGAEWDAGGGEVDDDDWGEFEEDMETADGAFVVGEMAEGFGELLAAARDARGTHDDTDRVDSLRAFEGERREQAIQMDKGLLGGKVGESPPAGATGGNRDATAADEDDDDETWQVRGKDADLDDEVETNMDDVEVLRHMMLKLQAARDLGADLPASERRRMAARAVREVMREV